MSCDACNKESVESFNIRYSKDNHVKHNACRKHYNIAMSKLLVFLKHVKRHSKEAT